MTAKIAKSRLFECLESDKIKRAVSEQEEVKNRSTGPENPKRGVLIDFPRSNSRIASTATFDKAMTLSAVFACHKILAETVASLPLEMFIFDKDRNRKPIFDHRLASLFRNKPNDDQTNVEFKETLMLNLINGNAYVRKYYYHKELNQLVVINNASVTPKLNDQGKKEYHITYFDGKKEVLTDKEIWHIKLFGTGLVGMSPLAYAARTIGVGLATDDKVGRIMENGAKPSGTLSTEKSLKKEQRQSLREEMSELVSGDDWFLPVLEGGLKFEKISLTPEDIELLDTRRFTIEEVCRFYGVPSVLVNDTNGSTAWGSGIEQIVEAFYRFGLRPYFERIEESARLNLLDRQDWDLYEFEFKIKDLLRASISTRVANNKTRIDSGQSTINEVRKEEGYEPIKGGDNLMVAANLITLDRAVAGKGETKNE
ncbi:TPA: phage portal protein [Acinetobacter baumannii]|nr:phage portal protein [Acinetobacter baumannii]